MDALQEKEKIEAFLRYLDKENKKHLCISVATGQSVKEAIQMTHRELKKQGNLEKPLSSHAEIQDELLAT